jgi:hypothetical protein
LEVRGVVGKSLARIGTGLVRGGKSAAKGAYRLAKPAAKPLGIGAATTAGLVGASELTEDIGKSLTSVEQAKNPPLQREDFDPNPESPKDDSAVFFDPKTGQAFTFGEKPSSGEPPEAQRSQDENFQQALKWGAVAVAAGGVIFLASQS